MPVLIADAQHHHHKDERRGEEGHQQYHIQPLLDAPEPTETEVLGLLQHLPGCIGEQGVQWGESVIAKQFVEGADVGVIGEGC